MIPTGGELQYASVEKENQPSRTYRLDFEKGRVIGRADGIEAVKQAVYKILQSGRYQHEIYSFNYGHELSPMIGRSPLYVQSEVTRLITEGLVQDDRIHGVENVRISYEGDGMTVTFTLITVNGNFDVTQEVN